MANADVIIVDGDRGTEAKGVANSGPACDLARSANWHPPSPPPPPGAGTVWVLRRCKVDVQAPAAQTAQDGASGEVRAAKKAVGRGPRERECPMRVRHRNPRHSPWFAGIGGRVRGARAHTP